MHVHVWAIRLRVFVQVGSDGIPKTVPIIVYHYQYVGLYCCVCICKSVCVFLHRCCLCATYADPGMFEGLCGSDAFTGVDC